MGEGYVVVTVVVFVVMAIGSIVGFVYADSVVGQIVASEFFSFALGPLALLLLLAVLGFTIFGIAAGSTAACCQSSNVEAGSIFACCQSAAQGGAPALCCFIIVGAIFGVTVTSVTWHLVLEHRNSGDDPVTNASNATNATALLSHALGTVLRKL